MDFKNNDIDYLKIYKNLIKINDIETFLDIIKLKEVTIDEYYELLGECVIRKNLEFYICIDKIIMKNLEKYEKILPDFHKIESNKIYTKINDHNILSYVIDNHFNLINIETFNTILYESSYTYNLQVFILASKYGNDFGPSYYEASRCGNNSIIEYINELTNKKYFSFQDGINNLIKKYS